MRYKEYEKYEIYVYILMKGGEKKYKGYDYLELFPPNGV